MVAAATDTKASPSPGEAADPLKGAVRAALVHSTALVLVSAAQHLQRTTVLVETATACAMARIGGESDQEGDHRLTVARAALADAVNLFEAAQAKALALASTDDPAETIAS